MVQPTLSEHSGSHPAAPHAKQPSIAAHPQLKRPSNRRSLKRRSTEKSQANLAGKSLPTHRARRQPDRQPHQNRSQNPSPHTFFIGIIAPERRPVTPFSTGNSVLVKFGSGGLIRSP